MAWVCRRPATDVVHAVDTGPAERAAMLQLAQAQQSTLAASRALFLKARQAILRQRAHLYKYDELSMCTARLKLRGTDNYSPLREQLYLHKYEVRLPAVPPAFGPGLTERCRGSGGHSCG